jgi:hypothetical protein
VTAVVTRFSIKRRETKLSIERKLAIVWNKFDNSANRSRGAYRKKAVQTRARAYRARARKRKKAKARKEKENEKEKEKEKKKEKEKGKSGKACAWEGVLHRA